MLEVINRPQITEDMIRSIENVRKILTPDAIFHPNSSALTNLGSEIQALFIKHRTLHADSSKGKKASEERLRETSAEVDVTCIKHGIPRQKLGSLELGFKAIVGERDVQLKGV